LSPSRSALQRSRFPIQQIAVAGGRAACRVCNRLALLRCLNAALYLINMVLVTLRARLPGDSRLACRFYKQMRDDEAP
jgi:hypothetical protein